MTRLNFKDKRSMQPLIWAGILLSFQVANACCSNPPNQPLEETIKNSCVRRPCLYYSIQHSKKSPNHNGVSFVIFIYFDHIIWVDAFSRSGAKVCPDVPPLLSMALHFHAWIFWEMASELYWKIHCGV